MLWSEILPSRFTWNNDNFLSLSYPTRRQSSEYYNIGENVSGRPDKPNREMQAGLTFQLGLTADKELPSVRQLSTKCRTLEISQPYEPPWPVTQITPFFYYRLNIRIAAKLWGRSATRDFLFSNWLWGSGSLLYVRFEVFTALTMKNGVFRDVMPCGSCKNRRFVGT
jgi:hypothetical protein